MRLSITKYLSVFLLFLTLSCTNSEIQEAPQNNAKNIGEFIEYDPNNTISLLHSERSDIDCKYCHNSKKHGFPDYTKKQIIDTNYNDTIIDYENNMGDSKDCYYLQNPNVPSEELSQETCSKCHY